MKRKRKHKHFLKLRPKIIHLLSTLQTEIVRSEKQKAV
jgi:hypothetical protein